MAHPFFSELLMPADPAVDRRWAHGRSARVWSAPSPSSGTPAPTSSSSSSSSSAPATGPSSPATPKGGAGGAS